MSSQICLKWNSFLNNIATSFESLWEEEGLVDVTLASDGQCLTAHKVILSASSPFFKKVFQTNPCQHPVIILQDVHFSELEALLIFIYKGEVNIEQKNLPALLKAAETLQIRGLSGGDIFSKDSYKKLAELEQAVTEDISPIKEDVPKKRQKVSKQQNNSILDKSPVPRLLQSENTNESSSSEQSGQDTDKMISDTVPNPIYQRLEMKLEPLEMTAEDLQKRATLDKDSTERLDTGQMDGTQETRQTSSPSSEVYTSTECPLIEEQAVPSETSIATGKHQTEVSAGSPNRIGVEPKLEQQTESTCFAIESAGGASHSTFPVFSATLKSDFSEETVKSGPAYPPFPCPFCDRAYTSWGFRRRHIKAVHTISSSLNCKWCLQVLPTHAAWRRHVIFAHNLSANDAHNGLLILEEAHMVLQIARPTRLGTLVNIIKQSSQQNSVQDGSQSDKN